MCQKTMTTTSGHMIWYASNISPCICQFAEKIICKNHRAMIEDRTLLEYICSTSVYIGFRKKKTQIKTYVQPYKISNLLSSLHHAHYFFRNFCDWIHPRKTFLDSQKHLGGAGKERRLIIPNHTITSYVLMQHKSSLQKIASSD